MKKVILTAAVAMSMVAANAQVTVQGSKFTDNWSLGLKGGMVTPMTHHSFFGNARGVFGFELQKQVTPVLGLGLEGQWSINTSSWFQLPHKSANAIDHQYIGGYAALNMMNLFAGYAGTPRLFEMELVGGLGWLKSYNLGNLWDGNAWAGRLGLNFNFNLGEEKAWTVSFKPSILWDLSGSNHHYYAQNLPGYFAQYNVNTAAVELLAGVTYHFGNSNGTHSFVVARLYDQAEVDGLNSQVNQLRNDLANCNANNTALQNKVNSLQAELDACNRRPPVIKEVNNNLNNVRYIFFRQGSSYIQANQKPNLELVAKCLEENNGSVVEIKGYASPEGSKAFNQRLSDRRAEVVKNALVKEYKVDANRIETKGMGVGDIFSVPTWNRVAVCTVQPK